VLLIQFQNLDQRLGQDHLSILQRHSVEIRYVIRGGVRMRLGVLTAQAGQIILDIAEMISAVCTKIPGHVQMIVGQKKLNPGIEIQAGLIHLEKKEGNASSYPYCPGNYGLWSNHWI
jgi:hypothetical protein